MFLEKIRDLNNSLLFHLTLLYAIAFTSLSSVGFLVFYYRIYDVTMNTLDIELHDEVRKYSSLLNKSGLEGIQAAIVDEGKFEDVEDGFYRIFDIYGNIMMSTDMSVWKTIPKPNFPKIKDHIGLSFELQTLKIHGMDIKARTITAALTSDYGIQIGESLEEVDDYMEIFLNLFSTLIVSLILVSTLIGWILAKRAIVDMQEVTDTAEEISNGVFHRRVHVNGRLKEIQRLGTTFNSMLDRIHALLSAMKEINDNIAHDLRSPLARIRGIAEMNLIKDDNSIDAYKMMAVSTIEECDALIEMINTMLEITEEEAGVSKSQLESFDLVELIQEACELYHPIAKSNKIDLNTSLPKSLKIKSDRRKLQRIVTNLLENAIKYSPENKSVVISASAQNGEILIDIEDAGMGISDNDLPHVFERFYRCDRSRSTGGVGLGLSLVKAYTESINGKIYVKSIFNQGSCFTLRFNTFIDQSST
ncbi:MAG: HAMP domain-containing sensor histidine kinase [Desulfobacteraceae bacterium]|jgi:signal transduction histidine kinase